MKMNFVVDDDNDSKVDNSSNPYMRGAFHDVMNLVIANNFEGIQTNQNIISKNYT
jgi:hypothetical protein